MPTTCRQCGKPTQNGHAFCSRVCAVDHELESLGAGAFVRARLEHQESIDRLLRNLARDLEGRKDGNA